jgi:hypothetical protein
MKEAITSQEIKQASTRRIEALAETILPINKGANGLENCNDHPVWQQERVR